jgi:hypothetical protein
MELFERLAYYGMALVLGIYVVDHLGIPVDRYGWVYGVFTGALYLLPLLAGALADRFGYKPALAIAFATLTAGYFVLGAATSFGWLCVALGLIAVGGSIIKPTISGTVTRTTVEGSTRPVGLASHDDQRRRAHRTRDRHSGPQPHRVPLRLLGLRRGLRADVRTSAFRLSRTGEP